VDSNPPRHLKARVARSLREQGLIAAARPRWIGPLAAAGLAVAALLLVALWPRPGDDQRPAFVLLLYEDAGFSTTRPEGELVAEYGAWAAGLDRDGHLVLGEKLADASLVLETGGMSAASGIERPAAGRLTGLFVIRASDQEAALGIARTCPHLRYGGRVVVRPVES
jgi:hypothetical protein